MVRPAVEGRGAFLVDVSLKGTDRRLLVEVFCETETGISIEKCVEISREILPLIDSSEIVGDSFRLEVSSPGIGVPLRDERQYKRNIGKLMSVKYHDQEKVKRVEGDMTDIKDGLIVIETEEGPIEIGFNSIEEAVVKIRW